MNMQRPLTTHIIKLAAVVFLAATPGAAALAAGTPSAHKSTASAETYSSELQYDKEAALQPSGLQHLDRYGSSSLSSTDLTEGKAEGKAEMIRAKLRGLETYLKTGAWKKGPLRLIPTQMAKACGLPNIAKSARSMKHIKGHLIKAISARRSMEAGDISNLNPNTAYMLMLLIMGEQIAPRDSDSAACRAAKNAMFEALGDVATRYGELNACRENQTKPDSTSAPSPLQVLESSGFMGYDSPPAGSQWTVDPCTKQHAAFAAATNDYNRLYDAHLHICKVLKK